MDDLIQPTERGLFCEAGDFFIDPWKPVDRAVITHAHADHAIRGCRSYLCSSTGEGVLRLRVGADANLRALPFGETIEMNGVRVSLHPAGHLLGSAQVRLEYGGHVWVISGDYKTAVDPSCEAFEPVLCDVFITESTFGLPIYHWPSPEQVQSDIVRWWAANRASGLTSVLYAYSLGKAQRVLSLLAEAAEEKILVHGAVAPFLPVYAEQGRKLAAAEKATSDNAKAHRGRALVLAPGSAQNTPWMKKFGPVSQAFASGWMRVRGTRRWRALDRGFVLSDHADWPGLLGAIEATGASRIGVTHGRTGPLVRWLKENGQEAWSIPTRYEGERAEVSETPEESLE